MFIFVMNLLLVWNKLKENGCCASVALLFSFFLVIITFLLLISLLHLLLLLLLLYLLLITVTGTRLLIICSCRQNLSLLDLLMTRWCNHMHILKEQNEQIQNRQKKALTSMTLKSSKRVYFFKISLSLG